MNEEKQAGSSGEEMAHLGPYRLEEQVPQDEYSRGELYLATHETSGAAALVLKPAAQNEKGPVRLSDWRVHLNASTSPGYFALEVEHTPRALAPDKHSVESLMCAFEDVREAVGCMDRALEAPNASCPWWRLGLALAGAAVLVVALLPRKQAPVTEVRVQEEAPVEAWATDVYVDPMPVIAGDAPRPVKNQKKAPCSPGLEVEVSGVCWLRIENRPCPPQTVAYQGQCLLPVAVPRSPVTSLDGGDDPEPL